MLVDSLNQVWRRKHSSWMPQNAGTCFLRSLRLWCTILAGDRRPQDGVITPPEPPKSHRWPAGRCRFWAGQAI